ncbi:MAG: hypothetical protein GVY19_13455 [Bacteroidetes bacterium]|jgi:hypothetical protein|nr:hypothetical protein [Bacteroidota bacterium]
MKKYRLKSGDEIIIDPKDEKKINQINWYTNVCRNNRKYVQGYYKGKRYYLHRFLLNVKDSNTHISFKNGNSLDFRRKNLVIDPERKYISRDIQKLISAENRHSKYLGVVVEHANISARIGVNGKRLYLGTYKSEDEAALAYNRIAIFYRGKGTYINDIHHKKIVKYNPKIHDEKGLPIKKTMTV